MLQLVSTLCGPALGRTRVPGRRYGFITYMTKESGEAAIAAMNGTDLKGRELKVGTATPRVRAGWGAQETG